MNSEQLEKALRDLPPQSLITEIPEIQNAIAHLLTSNQEMREFDPEKKDPDFTQAIKENLELIKRKEEQIDITLKVIREKLGEAAWREMGSNVREFRQIHSKQLEEQLQKQQEEEGIFL
ncbi:hypothetical protein BDF20DRAFT_904716 [Mycotypha africana]|uniref:uncharacterized protein n=1 Tax=Mycotypha africana TaxID=64632 RepID=UPI0023014B7C|nr:uncharacterized protein BDF20DRAFT_904716 [Mycotypha africana]KAI8987786.1 hypothetical protein BDF20DRAFT_904716 [Mycotypha africana]